MVSIGDGVTAAGSEGMTSTDPAQSEPAATPGAMPLDGFQSVGTATGDEAATGAEQGRNPAAIETNHRNHHLGDGLAELLSKGAGEAAG